jgi:hypothetical protein
MKKSRSKKADLEYIIRVQQDILNRLSHISDWALSTQRKFLNAAHDNWYLGWKVDYLIKKIKQHMPEEALKENNGELGNYINDHTPFKEYK